MAEVRKDTNFFHAHLHSQFSSKDGMTSVSSLLDKAVLYGHPAMALTDHGNMGGTVQLYKGAKARGIKPFPGIESYLIDPARNDWKEPARGSDPVERFHFGLLALSEEGYKGLVKFSSLTHTRPNFNRFPRASLADLAAFGKEYGEHIALTTGCFFGLVQQGLTKEGETRAYELIDMYSQMFPNTFVELQDHNIDHSNEDGTLSMFERDSDIVIALADIANNLNLPVIATQDAHYTHQQQKGSHALMKKMAYHGGADNEFPGDSFHFASAEWVAEHYTQKVWDRIEDGFDQLLDLNNVKITPLDTFKPDVPKINKDPHKTFIDECTAKHKAYMIAGNFKGKKYDEYTERFAYEVDVIQTLGMEEYFNIVHDYVEWCDDNNICVEARGSGNGSYICYLLKITQVDPVLHGVDFDRFLSKDRIKPPDIDMDIEDDRRGELLEYLLTKYKAVQIGTWSKLGTRYDEQEDREKGSILTSWQSMKRRECEAWATRKGEKAGWNKSEIVARGRAAYAKYYGHITDIRQVEDINPDEYPHLRELAEINSVFNSYGVHAGGVLLSGAKWKIEDYIPTMLVASSNTRVSQYDMDDVEEFGLLKMDILGQSSLRMMKIAQELIGVENPTSFEHIPFDDPAACKILREGRTKNGIFHFEGYTKAKGGKEMGIRKTKDAILASALYMPGAMNSGQTAHYIRMRKDRDARAELSYVHPIFEKHLAETYGAYVYQNQVMSILKDLGFDIPSINVFLKVVKDSGAGAEERNAGRIGPLKAQFDKLWKQHRIDPSQREEIWEALCGFAAYGFNKAHATGYGIRSYRTAWLKAHYPLEFMTALLQTWAGKSGDKENDYIKEARRLGIRLMPAHVNLSTNTWTIDPKRKAIRRGLSSIAGIGDKTAIAIAECAPFTSVEDMYKRVPGRSLTGMKDYLSKGVEKGITKALIEAKALRDMHITENEAAKERHRKMLEAGPQF